jgi:peptidoglycan/LPS O-acetylase OafA/YrhL
MELGSSLKGIVGDPVGLKEPRHGVSLLPAPAAPPARPAAKRVKDETIETLRGLAILSVVIAHVIGDDSAGGLRLEADSPWLRFRHATDHMRMPIFFAVSGFLYAQRPVVSGAHAELARGKLRLLLLPFLSVATLQYLTRLVSPGITIPFPPREMWRIYVFGLDQFWFSQATICMFGALILLEVFLRVGQPYKWPAYFLLALIIALTAPRIPIFSLDRAAEMLPLFFLGCLLYRPPARLLSRPVVATVALVFLASLAIEQLVVSGRLAGDAYPARYLTPCVALSSTFLLFRFRRAIPPLSFLGGFSYPIYLFHFFGTAGARTLLTRLDFHNTLFHLVVGTACGLSLPIAVDLLLRRRAILRRVFLGGR